MPRSNNVSPTTCLNPYLDASLVCQAFAFFGALLMCWANHKSEVRSPTKAVECRTLSTLHRNVTQQSQRLLTVDSLCSEISLEMVLKFRRRCGHSTKSAVASAHASGASVAMWTLVYRLSSHQLH